MPHALNSIAVTLLAQAGGGGGDAAASTASSVQVQSVWDFVLKGGPMMIPIGLCSLLALALVAERLISLRRSAVLPGGFVGGLRKVMKEHGRDKDKALAYCKRHPSPLSNVFAAGIRRLGAPLEVVEKQIQDAGEREVLKLRRFTRGLSVIAAVSPLLGLLGTIFGMINAFQTVALSAESLGKAELLAEGIYQAMITTAAGLCVAIPVLVAYHWISAKVERLVMEMDQMSVDFVEEYVAGDFLDETAPAERRAAADTAEAGAAGDEAAGADGGDVQVAPT